MPPLTQVLLSPAELSYLHSSLAQQPPLRPDGRQPTQFRPFAAETDVFPTTNGSARICFADGTEALVGVVAKLESSEEEKEARERESESGRRWVELSIEIPGFRDDDQWVRFLAEMLREPLLAGEGGAEGLEEKLRINSRFHWRLEIEVILISPPLSYPIALLSLTTHLALKATRLPALISEGDEDPHFNDDWEASPYLYPSSSPALPPITLLVVAVGDSIVFDPSKEELAVADAVLAISLAVSTPESSAKSKDSGSKYVLTAVRTIDPPARLTTPGVPDAINPAASVTGEKAAVPRAQAQAMMEESVEGVWRPRVGGMKRGLLSKAVAISVSDGGVAEEVFAGLAGVEVG